MDTDEAVRRLRAADPAAGVGGTWEGSIARERALHRPSDDVPASRRASTLLAVAAAAVVVIAVAAAVSVLRGDRTTAGSGTAPTGSTTAPTVAPGATPRERTQRLLARLLADVPALPGATPADTPPAPALRDSPSEPASSHLLKRRTWWTASGSAVRAIRFYRAHPPDGLRYSGSSISNGTKGAPGPESLMFDHRDTVYGREIQVLVSVVPLGNGVAIGAYAQAVWIPDRDPATLLADVSSVDVTVTRQRAPGRPGAPTVTRKLIGANAQTLADAVNALPVPTPGVFNCPAMFGGITNELSFVTGTGTFHVVQDLTGCSGVDMTLPDGSERSFEPGGLNAALMRVLGLPKNYGLS